MTLWTEFEAAVQLHGEDPIFSRADSCSYSELHSRVRRRAAFFAARGVEPGTRLAAFASSGPEFFELHFVAAALGAILVPLNLRLAAFELRQILIDARPRFLFAGSTARSTIAAAAADIAGLEGCIDLGTSSGGDWTFAETLGREGDFASVATKEEQTAMLYFTSGTTGRAKGVPLTHGQVCAHAAAAQAEFALQPADVWGHFAPMFHLADGWATFAVTFAGGRHAFLPEFDAAAVFATIAREGVTLTNLVPTMLTRMLRVPESQRGDTSSLRLLLSGGASMAPELVQRVDDLFGCEYAQTYGLTETSPFLTVSLPNASVGALPKAERAPYRSLTGRPFGGIELRVVDAAGQRVPADGKSVGEIQAKGPWVFNGYWQAPLETAAAFDCAWFKTGDLATLCPLGYLNIVDRIADVIQSGAETIYSNEVENALYTHPQVAEAAVFALADEEWGELCVAAVVRRRAASGAVLQAPQLLEHCRLFLAGYKLPRRLKFVDDLPRSGSGKIQKRILRERFLLMAPNEFDASELRR